MAYYRFKCGVFVKADSFKNAQDKLVMDILREKEVRSNWHYCTCLGISHRIDCPENPANKGETPL